MNGAKFLMTGCNTSYIAGKMHPIDRNIKKSEAVYLDRIVEAVHSALRSNVEVRGSEAALSPQGRARLKSYTPEVEMETKDKQLIAENEGYCGTCKYFNASLCKPTESTNTWESWFDVENADCRRYPPVFVGGNEDGKTDDGDFDSLNWQHPKVHAFCQGCGEYVRALWVPNA